MPCKAKVWVKSVIQDRNMAQCQFTITLFDTYLPKSLQGEARKHEKYKPKTEIGSKKRFHYLSHSFCTLRSKHKIIGQEIKGICQQTR